MALPGAPPVVRPPVEARKRWEDPFRQTFLVDGIEDGSKITMVYDPTQRVTEVDPDIEALVRGAGREIGGETIIRDITWTGPVGAITVIRKLRLPVQATPQA
jgi:hypothetical protein